MTRVQASDFAGKERIAGELVAQRCEHLAGMPVVFFADIRDGQENPSKWSEILTPIGGEPEFLNTGPLVTRDTAQPQDPADRGSHAADDVPADAGCEMSVVALGIHRQQLLGPSG